MKKILPILLALLFVLSFAACAQQETEPAEASTEVSAEVSAEASAEPSEAAEPVAEEVQGVTIPTFTVTVNGITVDQDAMAAYPMYSVQATSINSAGTETTITYVGFAMSDVLAAAALSDAYIWLEATADDGYAVTITGDTVLAETTLLAMTKDGEPFGTAPWLAPCGSETTGDYLKNCVSILVNTAEGAPEIDAAPSEDGAGGELTLTGETPELQDKTSKVEFAPYSFLVNGTEVTNDTLAALSIYKVNLVLENKSGELTEKIYAGYKLTDVLAACGIESPTSVKVVASDGYETELTEDLFGSEYTLVAIEKDQEVSGDGTVWLAPCSQTTTSSYIKLVVEIVAE